MAETTRKLDNLEFTKGDIFAEFLSDWYYVIRDDGFRVRILRRKDQEMTDEGWVSKELFRDSLKRKKLPGYQVTYVGNSPEVTEIYYSLFLTRSNADLGII